VAFVFYAPHDKPNGEAPMRYVLVSLAFLFGASQAQAQNLGPSPESDLGLASIVMVAAAAFLAYRFRRR
jgi:hypothetical protein